MIWNRREIWVRKLENNSFFVGQNEFENQLFLIEYNWQEVMYSVLDLSRILEEMYYYIIWLY